MARLPRCEHGRTQAARLLWGDPPGSLPRLGHYSSRMLVVSMCPPTGVAPAAGGALRAGVAGAGSVLGDGEPSRTYFLGVLRAFLRIEGAPDSPCLAAVNRPLQASHPHGTTRANGLHRPNLPRGLGIPVEVRTGRTRALSVPFGQVCAGEPETAQVSTHLSQPSDEEKPVRSHDLEETRSHANHFRAHAQGRGRRESGVQTCGSSRRLVLRQGGVATRSPSASSTRVACSARVVGECGPPWLLRRPARQLCLRRLASGVTRAWPQQRRRPREQAKAASS